MQKIKYPETKKVRQVDNYHGTEVSDYYRWLEDYKDKKVKPELLTIKELIVEIDEILKLLL